MHNTVTAEKRQEVLKKRKRIHKVQHRFLIGVVLLVLLFLGFSSVAMKNVGEIQEYPMMQEEIKGPELPSREHLEKLVTEALEEYRIKVQEELEAEKEPVIELDKPMIAITFDDGPGKYTEQLLDAVEANGVHVTFFTLGDRINDTNGHLLARMQELGCEVSNHSRNHADFTKISAEEIRSQVDSTNQKIAQYTGGGGKTFRPPYGAVNQTVRESVGMPLIFWSVDTLDWKYRDVNTVVNAMTTNIKDGDIILLHDIHQTSVEAAIIAIPILVEQGFQLVTVEEMATAKGVTLESGVKYFSF